MREKRSLEFQNEVNNSWEKKLYIKCVPKKLEETEDGGKRVLVD